MAAYKITLSKRAQKDAAKLDAAGLRDKAHVLLCKVAKNPYQPPCEKLIGDMDGLYSRRINVKHRLIYEVREKEKSVMILAMWTHYE